MSLAVVFAWQSRDLFAACKGEPADKKGITARNFVLKNKRIEERNGYLRTCIRLQ
jgi:hypothetical protein